MGRIVNYLSLSVGIIFWLSLLSRIEPAIPGFHSYALWLLAALAILVLASTIINFSAKNWTKVYFISLFLLILAPVVFLIAFIVAPRG